MTDMLSTENTIRTNLKTQILAVDIVAQPYLNATKKMFELNTRVIKDLMLESTEAAAALSQADWEPFAKLGKNLSSLQSPRATEYAVALGQILGAANTQIFVNAGWAGLGAQTDAALKVQDLLNQPTAAGPMFVHAPPTSQA